MRAFDRQGGRAVCVRERGDGRSRCGCCSCSGFDQRRRRRRRRRMRPNQTRRCPDSHGAPALRPCRAMIAAGLGALHRGPDTGRGKAGRARPGAGARFSDENLFRTKSSMTASCARRRHGGCGEGRVQGGCAGYSLLAAEPRSAASPGSYHRTQMALTKLHVCGSLVCYNEGCGRTDAILFTLLPLPIPEGTSAGTLQRSALEW